MQKNKLNYALPLLSDRVRAAVEKLPAGILSEVQEIRLRRAGVLGITLSGHERFVATGGRLTDDAASAFVITDADVDHTYYAALKNSIHSFEKEIRQGYVTAEGGNRVGFCGKAVISYENGERLLTLKDISSVNIRIASEMIGCSDDLCRNIFDGGLCSLLIAGPPASGKTTILRDLCRNLSERARIALADERGELAAVCAGTPQNSVGARTDIFTSYPKITAILTAVRVMSPEIIICDEVGSADELAAFEYAVNSGVRLIASCHAASFDELVHRPVISELLALNAFDFAVILGSGEKCGKVIDRIDLRNAHA